jgi:hypothetical protein
VPSITEALGPRGLFNVKRLASSPPPPSTRQLLLDELLNDKRVGFAAAPGLAPGTRAGDERTARNQADVVRYYSSLSSAGLNNYPLPVNRQSRPADESGHQAADQAAAAVATTSTPFVRRPSAALSCLDPAPNRTYQLNERIPKLDESCKACHCVPGTEIRQPVVFPDACARTFYAAVL